jgi:hypothetical protein
MSSDSIEQIESVWFYPETGLLEIREGLRSERCPLNAQREWFLFLETPFDAFFE